MQSNKRIVKCMYCGAELEWEDSNNPSDDGLHDIKDKYSDGGSACCSECNAITYINRQFKKMIDHPEETGLCLYEIKNTIESLNKNEIMEYYIKQKQMGTH